MFKKENRYMTRAIAEELSLDINILLWDLIDKLTIEKDYLQVFEINPIKEDIIKIVHKQEVPEYECTIYIYNEKIVDSLKIYAIDSVEYSTLMFSYQY
jgi:hypothetical protein